jgi:hypothetical protein
MWRRCLRKRVCSRILSRSFAIDSRANLAVSDSPRFGTTLKPKRSLQLSTGGNFSAGHSSSTKHVRNAKVRVAVAAEVATAEVMEAAVVVGAEVTAEAVVVAAVVDAEAVVVTAATGSSSNPHICNILKSSRRQFPAATS